MPQQPADPHRTDGRPPFSPTLSLLLPYIALVLPRAVRTARTGRTGASSVRSSDRFSVAEGKIEELEYRLQQERIARLRSEGELEVLKRQALEGAIEAATAKAGTGIRR